MDERTLWRNDDPGTQDGIADQTKENAKIKKYVRLLLGKERAEAQLHYYQQKNQKARARLLEALLEDPVIEYELITKN